MILKYTFKNIKYICVKDIYTENKIIVHKVGDIVEYSEYFIMSDEWMKYNDWIEKQREEKINNIL